MFKSLIRKIANRQTLNIVKKVISKIPNNEIGLRDKAILSTIMLTGARASELISLKINSINIKGNTIDIPFKHDFLKNIEIWLKYLVKQKRYSPQYPLFPKIKIKEDKSLRNEIILSECLTTRNISFIFHKRFKETSNKYYSPHDLRRLALSYTRE